MYSSVAINKVLYFLGGCRLRSFSLYGPKISKILIYRRVNGQTHLHKSWALKKPSLFKIMAVNILDFFFHLHLELLDVLRANVVVDAEAHRGELFCMWWWGKKNKVKAS